MECASVEIASRNIALRDDYELYRDDSFKWIDQGNVSVEEENEYLADMIHWEESPVLPISQWFDPPLEPTEPRIMTDDEVEDAVIELQRRLREKDIVLFNSGARSARNFYTLILRRILPMREKFLKWRRSPMLVDCSRRH